MSTQPTAPPSTPGQSPEGAQVNVPIGAIVENIHRQYQSILQVLVQENAQSQAGLEAQGSELAYLRSVVAAVNAVPVEVPAGQGSLLGPLADMTAPDNHVAESSQK